MLSIEDFIAKKEFVSRLVHQWGFKYPHIYNSKDQPFMLHLLVKDNEKISGKPELLGSESARLRFLELELERELKCTVVITTKDEINSIFTESIFNSCKLLAAVTQPSDAGFQPKWEFTKVENAAISSDNLDTVTLETMQELKKQIALVKQKSVPTTLYQLNIASPGLTAEVIAQLKANPDLWTRLIKAPDSWDDAQQNVKEEIVRASKQSNSPLIKSSGS